MYWFIVYIQLKYYKQMMFEVNFLKMAFFSWFLPLKYCDL